VIERDRLFLTHILEAVDAVTEFTAEGQDHFLADRRTQSAVIRQIEVIGEAVKRLSAELTASAPDVPWRLIAGTRDRLIHGYFQIDLLAVWTMVTDDLPPLRRRVQGLVDRA
jgi:uncharacterized protein with HEPN domain